MANNNQNTAAEQLFDSNNKLTVDIKASLDENVSVLNTLFDKCGDAVQKPFIIEREQGHVRIHIIYIDGLTDNGMVEETIIKPVSYEWRYENETDIWDSILYREAQTVDIKEETSFDLVIGSVLKGDTAIFVDGYAKALIMSTKKLPLRGIDTNDSEAGMRGPRDSFNEGFRQSTALIRRRIRDSKLKVEQSFIGQRSRTDYAIMYLSDIAQPELVEEIKNRLEKYDIDAVYDSGMAEHLLEETPFSPFPVFQSTTRPDKVAAAITEGRVAIVFDNSPEVIIAPANFNMLLQASDDYYNRWAVGTFARILRYIATFISVTLPGFYVAITVYQSEIIPTKLLYAISSARSLVTFPIVLEVLIMEFLFELLREAGIRLPGPLGNTIGVVGGLIVGQSAVDAGIVSTMVVIVVALTAIASFAIPNEVFASVFRLLKFFILLTSACFGLYGFILGLLIIAIHLSELTSFGVPYMAPTVGGGINQMAGSQDFIVRSPIKVMVNRPIWAQKKSRRRLKQKGE
ncbi:MAG: spore germination protein [Clostridium sp.]|nr:spore germination protein [Clostridium sp.]MCM1460752.1 spore germination protein [Bacteroides sp.]